MFVSRRDGISNLWALEETTDWLHRRRIEPVQLTAGPIGYVRPLPSTDGACLFATGTQLDGELLRYDGARHEFLPFLAGGSFEHLDFRGRDQAVAYVAYPEGTLWRARRWERGRTVDLAADACLSTALVAGRQAHPLRCAPARRDAADFQHRSNPEPLLHEAHAQTDPTWSPDGLTVV